MKDQNDTYFRRKNGYNRLFNEFNLFHEVEIKILAKWLLEDSVV